MLQKTEDRSFTPRKKNGSGLADGRYQTLFEQVNAATFLTTIEGKILEANMRSCDLLEYSWDELIDLSLQEILTESTDWSQLVDEISAKGGMQFETEIRRKDGNHVPVDVSTSLFIMGERPVMLALIQDITKRKKAEQQLKESEQKYRGLFESTTDGILVLNARGEILDVNGRALDLLKLSKEEVLQKDFLGLDVLTAKSLPVVVEQFEHLLSHREAKTHKTELQDKEGNILHIELSSFFLVKQDNEVDNFVVTLRDMSDRREAEIKLAREHELLQTLLDNTPDSIYFKDEQNRFILVNKAKAAHSQVSPKEMIGKTDFDFLAKQEAVRAATDDEDILKTGKYIVNKVEKLTAKDGTERWVSVTKVPRFDEEGNIIGTMGISRDVTEWKRLEEPHKQD
ncbi:MAG: PAS domain-containing protein [Candidatus Thermoplasmatota archaeon]|nr:PAS domain-containing protein [Candidatus Thermoplasmatota archaeon]